MRTPLLLLTLGVALAACGQTPAAIPAASRPLPPSSSVPPATTPTPAPERALIAVADGSGTTLALYTLDGSQVAHVTLSPSQHSGSAGVGGGMLTFVDGGVLKGMTPDGTVLTLGPLTGWNGGRAVVGPDGQHWMWAVYSADSASGSTSSKLVLGRAGAPDRVVASQTVVGRTFMPLRWTAVGPTYQSMPMGIGGYILFGDSAMGPSYRFDPDTGRVSPVVDGSCDLADLATDGTIACFRLADHTLAVLVPDGHSPFAVTLPTPAFNQEGALTFAPGPTATTLVVGGATGAGPAEERYQTDLLDIASRTLRPFGPAGLRPAPDPWLPDGSLVAYRPAGAYGGDPGIYVVAPDGTARRVLPSGTPIGVVIARG